MLIGNDNGTFTEEITSPIETGSVLTQIAVADFNNDNQLDLAAIDSRNDQMRIFLGNVNATFRALATFSMGYENSPEKLTVCDFNGDNWLDIAVLNSEDNILVFLGNGNGNFSLSATLYTGQRTDPSAIATADFNGDGFLDIVITIFKGQNIFTYLGRGNGTFEEQIVVFPGIDSLPGDIVVGDFNNDTRPDVIFCYNKKSNIIALMIGYGNGTLDITTKFVIKTADTIIPVTVSDFNCDGHQDILLVQSSPYSIDALLGHGNGNFDTQTIFSLEIPDYFNEKDDVAVGVGDFNSDGFQDIFAMNEDSGVLYMLLNTCVCGTTDICKTNTFIRQ